MEAPLVRSRRSEAAGEGNVNVCRIPPSSAWKRGAGPDELPPRAVGDIATALLTLSARISLRQPAFQLRIHAYKLGYPQFRYLAAQAARFFFESRRTTTNYIDGAWGYDNYTANPVGRLITLGIRTSF